MESKWRQRLQFILIHTFYLVTDRFVANTHPLINCFDEKNQFATNTHRFPHVHSAFLLWIHSQINSNSNNNNKKNVLFSTHTHVANREFEDALWQYVQLYIYLYEFSSLLSNQRHFTSFLFPSTHSFTWSHSYFILLVNLSVNVFLS